MSTIAGPQQRIRLGVFPGYDIYLATDDGRIRKKLPDAPGYDAEATVNWKTGKVVYTSLASGDLDLWTMNADGSYKKQITRSLGYDGGAAFLARRQQTCLARESSRYAGNDRALQGTAGG